LKQRTREINNERIMQFPLQLANESWESICIDNDTTNKFNSYLHTFLNIFEASFPVKYKSNTETRMIGQITQGIRISYDDAVIKAFYIRYCKILNKVIQQAKRQHYNTLIAKTDDKRKTTWDIIKEETEKLLAHLTVQMPSILLNDEKNERSRKGY
jgi:hypothetical protein